LGEIRCKNLAHKTDDDDDDDDDDDLWVSLKSAQENPHFFHGLNEITQCVYDDTVEHIESKDASVNSVFYYTKFAICSLVITANCYTYCENQAKYLNMTV